MKENEKNYPQNEELNEQELEQASGGKTDSYQPPVQMYVYVYKCPECDYVREGPAPAPIIKEHTYCPQCFAKHHKTVYCTVTKKAL